MTIKARLLLLCLFLCFLLIVLGLLGLRNAAASNAALETVYKDRVVCLGQLKIISDMYAVNIVDSAHKARNGNITPTEALRRIDEANDNIRLQWDAYLKTYLTQEEKELIESLAPLMLQANTSVTELRTDLSKNDLAAVSEYTIHKLYSAIDPVTAKISKLIDLQLNVAKDQYETSKTKYQTARRSAVLMILLGSLFAFGISFALTRSILNPLRLLQTRLNELAAGETDLSRRLPVKTEDEIGQLSKTFNQFLEKLSVIVKQVQSSGIDIGSSTTSIAAFTKELEAAVHQQLASSNEVVATAGQISSTSQDLVNTMTDVAKMLNHTTELASSGQDGLTRLETSIHQIENATSSIGARLAAISERAQTISSVVTTISKVATQTNVLSFNAAIEAEKAGEFGHGFSIVAAEIRRLSDQTEIATMDIAKMMREMSSAVSAGMIGMDHFTGQVRKTVEEVRNVSVQLTQIIERVQSLSPRFQAVTDGMQSQSIAAQEIREAMIEARDAADHTSESLNESARMIEQLNRASKGLHKEVGRFKT